MSKRVETEKGQIFMHCSLKDEKRPPGDAAYLKRKKDKEPTDLRCGIKYDRQPTNKPANPI